MAAASATTRLCDALYKAKQVGTNVDMPVNELLGTAIDVFALIGNSSQVLNQFRRSTMKAKLPSKIQSLANNVPPGSQLLFGNDLNKRLSNITNTNKALLTTTQHNSSRQNFSYKKHNSKNYYAPPRSSASGKRGNYHHKQGNY